MSNVQSTQQKAAPGFWARLAYGIEEASVSYTELLERRIKRLEVEVERLLASERAAAKK